MKNKSIAVIGAEVMFSATPRAFMHYSGIKKGFMGSRNKWLSGKLKQLDFNTPIKNLYLTVSLASHAGATLALVSGLIGSNKILREKD
jgi:hypothetical protein